MGRADGGPRRSARGGLWAAILLCVLSVSVAALAVTAWAGSGPTVTSIKHPTGPAAGGKTVSIIGTNLAGATAVYFGSTEATSVRVKSSKKITATSPPGTGTVDITVTTPEGTSPLLPADQYTYTAGRPAVTKVESNEGPAAGADLVLIHGERFTGATAVHFGGTDSPSFSVNSDGLISAVTPPESVGRVDVTITTPYGTSKTLYCGPKEKKKVCEILDHYKFVEPTITEVSPNSGQASGGTVVTVHGTGFVPGATATSFVFGHAEATAVECEAIDVCTMVSPEHAAGTVDVKAQVQGNDGTRISAPTPADQFTFEP